LNDAIEQGQGSSYPPYNIRKKSEYLYEIELAVAGFGQKDINIELADGIITVKSIKENSSDEEILHRGISYRKFEKRFSIADDIQVKGAKLENGLLTIDLERIVPEEKKPRTIAIK
jgi:molecular chaperone IbpA